MIEIKCLQSAQRLLSAPPLAESHRKRATVSGRTKGRSQMPYVDGFVLAVPKAKLDGYRSFTRVAGEVLREHGACAYVECVGDQIPPSEFAALPHAIQPCDDEVVVYSWIVYDSKQERDRIHAEAMDDPRLRDASDDFPVDGKRLIEEGLHALLEV
jgi:uncharacterized protein YbaA (DUF1428 family)